MRSIAASALLSLGWTASVFMAVHASNAVQLFEQTVFVAASWFFFILPAYAALILIKNDEALK